ncbi:riboflavin kinase [Exophiala xenobiotica]
MAPEGSREPYAGPESGPEQPFPIRLQGPVIHGFGRGSKELGIPTANIPPSGLSSHPDLSSGVYYGFVGLSLSSSSTTDTKPSSSSTTIYPAVLSIGYNPFYKNAMRSVEIHILHRFAHDFYGAALNLLILGFIRPEYDYTSLEALVEDIKVDCEVAERSLQRKAYERYKAEPWLEDFEWMKSTDTEKVEKEVLKKN